MALRALLDGAPVAGLSIDLDDQWTYLKTRVDPSWRSMPSFLDLALPRVLEFLSQRGLRATFFIVGCDATRAPNLPLFRRIVEEGHEVGNHSFRHEPWLHLHDRLRLEEEVRLAESAIEDATGRRPVGFRGPGNSVSAAVLEILAERGYVYDASPLPTFLMPVVRRAYFSDVAMGAKDRADRSQIGGGMASGFGPNRPYVVRGTGLVVLPVTTTPGPRLPFHGTYLNALQEWSRGVALRYFDFGLAMCRWTGTEPSFLLHLTDFLGSDDPVNLSLLPGMRLPYAKKESLLDTVVCRLRRHHRIVTLAEHASQVRSVVER